jgi:hypothetical protein
LSPALSRALALGPLPNLLLHLTLSLSGKPHRQVIAGPFTVSVDT